MPVDMSLLGLYYLVTKWVEGWKVFINRETFP